ncbi:mobilization protein [uncultured Aliiroseovarius sp.]|uniref:mobilization protein n=1 Tax=uncultured Aliiroseovarius sp. TaxID=1658783 RepID=UPI002598E920|nr:mobilization protein [uncultured Aliiroseovarius sp.]
MAETQLEKLERQYAQAKNRLQAAKAREATKQRKLDARRKIILGGALLDLAGRDESAAAMVDRLLRNLPREQDRKAFDGWAVARTSPAPESDPLTAMQDNGAKGDDPA